MVVSVDVPIAPSVVVTHVQPLPKMKYQKYGPSSASNCDAVYWTTGAILNGPVHSNDGLYVCGSPSFNGDTDTYYNSPTSNPQRRW